MKNLSVTKVYWRYRFDDESAMEMKIRKLVLYSQLCSYILSIIITGGRQPLGGFKFLNYLHGIYAHVQYYYI